jgi:AcrR family transcriptional regulator
MATNEPSPSPSAEGPRLPPGVALAWGLDPPSTRGPKPALTVDQIVAAAMALGDEGGLAAVSMSKVAQSLGYTTMALYRYVKSKHDLLALMVDVGCGPPPAELFEPAPSWREATERWARAILARYQGHVWIFGVEVFGPPIMPNQLAWLDVFLRGMADTGLSYNDQLSTSLLVDGYVRSWAQLSDGLNRAIATEGTTSTPPPNVMAMLVTEDRYPALAPMIAAGEFDGGENEGDDFNDIFEYSLERILDGIEVLVDRMAATPRPASRPKPTTPKRATRPAPKQAATKKPASRR